ncbi:hypothetical protein Tsubulata_000359 [Turnera subulata]|uniref:Large ribosomal subunit protein bL12 C-terminal domain-containing protein n=1 Tax=Turnera subulata TaxID=218843 RepID=A0A9Q0IZQ6_9ROSI|nr:hypothetical protein Tsubulata_000359 [Turnera subulata]
MRNLRFISSHFYRTRKNPTFVKPSRQFTSQPEAATPPTPPPAPAVSAAVSGVVDDLAGLTLLEIADLTHVLREKLGNKEMPIMGVMMPGASFGAGMAGMRKGPGGAAAGAAAQEAEKTAFDLKLESYDTAAKIKVIKEVRACTDLGLKEAKDLVEKAPTLLKKGVTKEEAEQIIAKLKEAGAKVSME